MNTPLTVRVSLPPSPSRSRRTSYHYFLGESGFADSLCGKWVVGASTARPEPVDAVLAAPASSRAGDCKACVAKARSLLAKGGGRLSKAPKLELWLCADEPGELPDRPAYQCSRRSARDAAESYAEKFFRSGRWDWATSFTVYVMPAAGGEELGFGVEVVSCPEFVARPLKKGGGK